MFSEQHLLRNARTELYGGELVRPHESPERAQMVLERVRAVGLGPITAPSRFGLAPVLRAHDEQFVEFLRNAWADWVAAGNRARRFRTVGRPDAWRNVVQMGLPGDWVITRWLARHRSAPERGRPRVPRLTWRFPERPFLGTARVPRLRYVALHGDPSEAFPYFSGFADEAGADAGEGYNINFPLPRATGFGLWQQTLATALACIRRYSPDALVVSLGVNTFVRDPISFFRLESSDFSTYGGMIGACRIPTLFVFEGGYAVADVGVNVVNVLAGFEDV